jgi:hypothetical protein
MAIDLESVRLEGAMWTATPQLRWFRPPGGNDNDIRLEQLYERITGERSWRLVPTCP